MGEHEPNSGAENGGAEKGGAGRERRGVRSGAARGVTPSRVYPEPVERLIAEFARLPGIGRRSAERLALHVLKEDEASAMGLARAIHDVKRSVHHCAVCYNLSDSDRCAICQAPDRDRGVVLVVEQPRDLIALEQTGAFKGIYHVLLGRLSPLDGIGPGDITAGDLVARVAHPERNAGAEPVREVVLGLNPTLEGDGTALYLTQELRRAAPAVRITRLARGLASGGTLEMSNRAVLSDAITERRAIE